MEQSNLAEQSQPNSDYAVSDNSVSGQPVQHAETPTEKMIPQSKVDEIVRSRTSAVAQKARQEALAEHQRSQQHSAPVQNENQYSGNNSANLENLVSQQVQSHIQKIQQQAAQENMKNQANQLLGDFNSRIDAVESNYDDFEDVVGVANETFARYPLAVMTTMAFDNTGDIAYELSKTPSKLAIIESLARDDAENLKYGIKSNLAAREMKRLSDSIKTNQNASNQRTAKAPLSHVKSSPAALDNGLTSVNDFRSYYKKKR